MSNRPDLDAVQRWMQDALVFPQRTESAEAEQFVQPSPRMTSAQRLGIYQRSYYLRLLKCMDEQFPALRYALGAELFSQFAREYLQALPSQSYTLHDLGNRFPGYLESTRPDREKPESERETWINFMVDLAQGEHDLYVMFEAPGHEGKPLADEQVQDDRLALQPCFALHKYRFPVSWYYFQVKEEKQPPLPPEEPSFVALVRKDYRIRTFPLNAHQYSFLGCMAKGIGVRGALAMVVENSGKSIAEVTAAWSGPAGVRKRWIEAGFFIETQAASASIVP